jgi:hypothetical protein
MGGWTVLVSTMLLGAAAAAGCAGPTDDAVEGCATEPCTSTSAPSSVLDGVVLDLVRTDQGRDHRLDATVRNTGSAIFYYLWVPHCGEEPWTDSMAGPDGPVSPREPLAVCQPCGWDALSPGDSLTKTYEWDERVWEDPDFDGHGTSRDAPSGHYTWIVRFYAERRSEDACGGDDFVQASTGIDVD